MDAPSNETLKILKVLNTPYPTPEDKLPSGYDWSLLPNLVSIHWVKKVSLVHPNREPDYPHGLWGYITDSAGKEVLYAADDHAQKESAQDAKERRRYIFERIEFWIGLLVGWLLGGLTPKEVFEWVGSLFH